jgi:lysophospholipase L1-like esterase
LTHEAARPDPFIEESIVSKVSGAFTRPLVLVCLALAVALAVVTAMSPVRSATSSTPVALVLGDSITQRYTDDPGDPMQGWWSMVGRKLGWDMVTSAQDGDGIVKKGSDCYGTAIRERQAAVVERVRPDWILVEAGYNDRTVCVDGQVKTAAVKWRAGAMTKAFAGLAALADRYGIARNHVVVTVPWGPAAVQYRHEVVIEISTAAKAAGLSWVNVPRFTADQVYDGKHPKRAGSVYLASVMTGKIQEITGG